MRDVGNTNLEHNKGSQEFFKEDKAYDSSSIYVLKGIIRLGLPTIFLSSMNYISFYRKKSMSNNYFSFSQCSSLSSTSNNTKDKNIL